MRSRAAVDERVAGLSGVLTAGVCATGLKDGSTQRGWRTGVRGTGMDGSARHGYGRKCTARVRRGMHDAGGGREYTARARTEVRGTGTDGSARLGVRDMMLTARVCSAGHNGERSLANGAAVDPEFGAPRAGRGGVKRTHRIVRLSVFRSPSCLLHTKSRLAKANRLF